MPVAPASANASRISVSAAWFAIAASASTLLLLASLHVLSPEFDPSWRMVSEYAFGRYGAVLSAMFFACAVSSWALAAALWSQATTGAARMGLVVLLIAGLGEALAAVFDIRHDFGHTLAGLLGIVGLPVAAVLISSGLRHDPIWRGPARHLLRLAHLTWISVVLLIGSMILMTVEFVQANGGKLPQHAPRFLPSGVTGLDGWANRLIVVSFCLWVAATAWQAIRVQERSGDEPSPNAIPSRARR
jgi:hypothetical protein